MTDLHEEAEQLAQDLDAPGRGLVSYDAANTLRALSTRLAEVERERDEWVAAAYEKAARVMEMRDDSVAPDNTEAYDRGWSRACKTGAAHIRALARPEETDALARIRAEAVEEAAQMFDDVHLDYEGAVVVSMLRARAAAIREDKT